MTNGAPSGTNGERRIFLLALIGVALIVAAVNIVNVSTVMQDRPYVSLRAALAAEVSSGLAILALAWIPWAALKLAPLEDSRRLRTAAIHLAALLAFSLLHVAGFILLRTLAWAVVGQTYDFGGFLERFPYELRKDVLSYAGVAAAFWIARRLALQTAATASDHAATFDIRDGARVIRVPITDILAVASAGNYVEVHLADGRKPLMRSSLAAVESQLSPFGFVRTHRSWIVSAARVSGLTPAGSGDYTVTLGSLEAPLSRRFPAALMRLRGG